MTTATIIMAVCLIALLGVAIWLIVRYMRKTTEVELKAQSLASAEKETAKRKAALDKWCAELKDQKSALASEKEAWEANKKHIYYNVVVNDPSAPDFPDTKAFKALKSGIGYRTASACKDYITVTRKDGKTIYSLDIYVAPFES